MHLKQEVTKPKDTAFRHTFKSEENLVKLYEFCTGKRLDPTEIEATTLEDGVIESPLYNDVSFLTKDNRLIVLIEHQSSVNHNMAIRMLEYYLLLLNQYLEKNNHNRTAIELPKAEFFVAYNGHDKFEPELLLDLSAVQVRFNVINIRYEKLDNHNLDNPIAGYAYLIKRYEENVLRMDKLSAFRQAIFDTLDFGYLRHELHGKECTDMILEAFSYENQIRYEERREGILATAKKLLNENVDIPFVMKITDLSEQDVIKIKEELEKSSIEL